MTIIDQIKDKKEEPISVLIIADTFSPRLTPIVHEKPLALFDVGGQRLLDLVLEWVSRLYANVFVASSTLDKETAQGIQKKWKTRTNLEMILCEGCNSTGDIMREVDKRRLITKEFILIDQIPTFCSSKLTKNIAKFRALRKKNRNNVMQILVKESKKEFGPYVIDKETHELLVFNSPDEGVELKLNKRNFSAEHKIRCDLKPCGIYICGPEIIAQFSDNFDFLSLDNLIRGILIHEEIMCQNIFLDILDEDVFAQNAIDYDSLLECLWAFQHGKFHPTSLLNLHPNHCTLKTYSSFQARENNVYVVPKARIPVNSWSCVFGGKFDVHPDAKTNGSFFGDNLVIGAKARLSEVVAGKNFKVGDGVVVKRAIIGDNVTLGANVTIKENVIIGNNVTIPPKVIISRHSVIMVSDAPPHPDYKTVKKQDLYFWTFEDDGDNFFWELKSHPQPKRLSAVWSNQRQSRSSESLRQRRISFHDANDSSPENYTVWPHTDPSKSQTSVNGPKSPLTKRKKHNSGSTATGATTKSAQIIDVLYETSGAALERFDAEVKDSMKSALEAEEPDSEAQQRKVILEINSSKLAYNIGMDDVAKHVFLAFMSMPNFGPTLKDMKDAFSAWTVIWANYYRPQASKVQLLHAIEDHCALNPEWIKYLPNFILFLFNDAELLPDDMITTWYEQLPADSPLKTEKMGELVEWLNQEDDDEDDDEDEDED
ncbi:unnamed protein product [Bursaphelenchus xylophilus]|uniref:Translation initiation factor eIF2B subunit epsilon n=1 Tax=Bursaphelenchus xylophilus TaxID=6326 RepID=A0A1I7S468_BURXY|nr:unnamed protein product [Bursaphelenchus xylophilus]CAG9116777.1 unnamed protein product [Bursaphelenchus xylophilus]